MAAIKSEMPPLHAAETTATSLSSLGSGGLNSGGGVGVAGINGSSANSASSSANSTTTSSTSSGGNASAVNNTISAAADSSDNQPGTPQPQTQHIGANDQQQAHHITQTASSSASAHAFGAHNMYATASTTTSVSAALPHMYAGGIYASSANGNNVGSGGGGGGGHDMQQQQAYPSYLNSYEQFYQQQGQTQSSGNQGAGSGVDYGNTASLYSSSNSVDYKGSAASTGVRYHPYLQAPTSNGPVSGNGNNEGQDASAVSAGMPSNSAAGAVSTTSAMSPRVVSSSSPTSTSSQVHGIGSGNNGGSSTNPQSPACNQQLLCKKCGIMCTNESELQEHITNVHGASPYGSSGYSSSPYIKEELSAAPSSQPPQQQSGANPGELLDLDSQKMVYPPIPGSMQSIMGGHSGLHHQQHHAMHDAIVSDPLHSMHTMQQRALPGWDQPSAIGSQDSLPSYMQQADIGTTKPNQSPYYSPKQSPYGGGTGMTNIKHEYPLIKSEYADSQNYSDKSFDPNVTSGPDMCQQQTTNAQQSMMPVSSSPAEFPSTTTGPAQDQQQFRSFEPPTSSSVLPANSITAKAATWKSNEARRPKTYNCTACNKWFTSSGHLKRHYNTTLHKNAVKTSGQPDPATLPISAHHHPARDPSGKHSRRSGNNSAAAAAAAAAQQQKPPAPVQPPEPPRTPPDYVTQGAVVGSGNSASGLGPMSHYSTSPSPTSGGLPFGQQNGYQPMSQAQQSQAYLSQVQSTTSGSPQNVPNATSAHQSQTQSQNQSGTILNGHPNGLAGPSALTTLTTVATPTLLMPSSHTRGLLNTTTTTTIKREVSAEEDIINNSNSSTIHNTNSPMDMVMTGKEMGQEAPQVVHVTAGTEVPDLHRHQLLVKQELPDMDQGYQQLLDQHHQLRHYHNSTPSSRAQSPLIISHQQYQEQLHLQQQQQQQPMVADNIFSLQQQQAHMLQPQLPPLSASTMEAYSIIPLDTNTQLQHTSNMQLLQPSQRTTNTHMATTASMLDSIPTQQHSLLHHLQQQEERAALELEHNTANTTTTINSMPGTQQHINTTITRQPQHMLTPLPQLQPSTTNPIIPSFQQLPQPEALQLEHTMTYHTIIGNQRNGNTNGNSSDCDVPSTTSNDLVQLSSYDPYGNGSMFTTSDGQILQFMPNNAGSFSFMHPTYFSSYPTRTAAVAESYVRSYSTSNTQRSPQEADLPPASTLTYAFTRSPQESQTTLNMASEMPYSPTVSSSTAADGNGNTMLDEFTNTSTVGNYAKDEISSNSSNLKAKASTAGKRSKRSIPSNNPNPPKRKRVLSGDATVATSTGTVVLPSGRIKCVDCDKEFTKICYFTQHNKCFHSGEYPYRCEKCGKRFQSEEVYTTHLGRHKTLDKPHKCQLCPKQFHHKTDLRRHIEAIHTGLKQHTCDICEKSFCRKDHLRKHLETHNRPRVISRKTSKVTSAQRLKELENDTKKNASDSNDHRVATPINELDSIGDNHAELDVLVVVKNEPHFSEFEENHLENSMATQMGDMVPDDESLLEDDEDDDDVEIMMKRVSHMQQQQQQQQGLEQQQRKLLHEQQQQPLVVYVNEAIQT